MKNSRCVVMINLGHAFKLSGSLTCNYVTDYVMCDRSCKTSHSVEAARIGIYIFALLFPVQMHLQYLVNDIEQFILELM